MVRVLFALVFVGCSGCAAVGPGMVVAQKLIEMKKDSDRQEHAQQIYAEVDKQRIAQQAAKRERAEANEKMWRERNEKREQQRRSAETSEPAAEEVIAQEAAVVTAVAEPESETAEEIAARKNAARERFKDRCSSYKPTSEDKACMRVLFDDDVRLWAAGGSKTVLGDMIAEGSGIRAPTQLLALQGKQVPALDDPPEHCGFESSEHGWRPAGGVDPDVMPCWWIKLEPEVRAYLTNKKSMLTEVVARAHKSADDLARSAHELSTDGSLRIVGGPRVGDQFAAGAWGFELTSYELSEDDDGESILTVDYLAENKSRGVEMVSSDFSYVLDSRRIKRDSSRLADMMGHIFAGGHVLERIPPGTRVERRETFRLPPEVLATEFSLVFEDPSSPMKRTAIRIKPVTP